MANKKITALTALSATPATDDVLPIVDVSGTATTKKVTVANLVAAAPQGDLVASNNLSDVANAGTSRSNLGLGTAATSASTDFSPAFFTIVAESGATRTLSDSDNGKVIVCSASGGCDVTVASGLTSGFNCTLVQSGSGQVKVEGASGVTIAGISNKTATAGQHAAINIVPIASNSYIVGGEHDIPAFINTASIDLDGANDYIDAGTISGITVGTVSVWFKADSSIDKSTPDYLVALGDGDEGITFGGHTIFGPASNGVITVANGNHLWSYAGSSTTINTNWHHVAIVWNASSSSTNSGNAGYDIYLDGSNVGNQFNTYSSGNGSQLTADRVRVGARDRSGAALYNFAGLVDELSIYTASLSSAQITNLYRGESSGGSGGSNGVPGELSSFSPSLWWRMGDKNGSSGTTITDQGSAGNNGTLTNGPTYSTSVPS